AAVLLEDLGHEFDQFGIVVHQQHFALAAFEGVGGDAVVLHELVEGFAGNTAEPGAGHPEPFELTIVEAADNRLLAYFADFGGLAGRKNGLHACSSLAGPWPAARVWSTRCHDAQTSWTGIIRDLPLGLSVGTRPQKGWARQDAVINLVIDAEPRGF